MITYVLIIVLATSLSGQSGSASVVQEFKDERACLSAGNALVKMAQERSNHILTWGCFVK